MDLALRKREQQVLDAMADMEAHSDCGYVGHEWEPAGGGLLICVNCTSEKWDDAPGSDREPKL
jgi:hypothetical protein